ncbi:hypothetical protein LR48_Vigan2360s000100 [Vigna angularis]|nr:hypothetical protein LR48_Vigan2360s000100 [Vigna angularis]
MHSSPVVRVIKNALFHPTEMLCGSWMMTVGCRILDVQVAMVQVSIKYLEMTLFDPCNRPNHGRWHLVLIDGNSCDKLPFILLIFQALAQLDSSM